MLQYLMHWLTLKNVLKQKGCWIMHYGQMKGFITSKGVGGVHMENIIICRIGQYLEVAVILRILLWKSLLIQRRKCFVHYGKNLW